MLEESKVINNYLKKRRINGESIDKLPEEVLINAPEEVLTDFKSFIRNNDKITNHT